MIKQKTQLEIKINERDHTYQCDPSSPLPEVLEALNVFRSYIFGRLKENEETSKVPDQKEEVKPE